MAVRGKPVRAIARELGLARNTVRKYVRGPTEAAARAPRPSKLDPYKAQIRHWIEHDHLYNCQTMYRRLREQGYTGRHSILKDFVHPLRPVVRRHRRPVIRYETGPGEQLQFDIRDSRSSGSTHSEGGSAWFAGIQSERVEAWGARPARQPGRLWYPPETRRAGSDSLQYIRRSLVSAPAGDHRMSRWSWPAAQGRGETRAEGHCV
jgi:hypothetical protein